MLSLSADLYGADAVAELDRVAIASGIPSFTLMRRAGEALYRLLRSEYPDAHRVLVFCGAGNNGGDGYVLARLCQQAGMAVTVTSLVDTASLSGSAATACEQWQELGTVCTPSDIDIGEADVVIDAMLGIGLDRDVCGDYLHCIELINTADVPVIAVDIPSGLDADTGSVRPQAVLATHTLTFIARKLGLFTGDGKQHCGEVILDDLDVPTETFDSVPSPATLITAERCRLPRRPHNSHKSAFGHVLIVGGDHGMAGAVAMASKAALKIGAGMVSVITRPEHVGAVTAICPEAMVRGSDIGDVPDMSMTSVTHVLAGCGLGQGPWSQRLLHHVLQLQQPVVYDADALNLVASQRLMMDNAVLLTPHPGEAARLLGCPTRDVQSGRFASARELRHRFGCHTVLKGSGTVIADEGHLYVCDAGSATMATAGMGDVLAGFAVGLLAQGLDTTAACCAAVWYHAAAADLSADGKSRGILATDIIQNIGKVMHER